MHRTATERARVARPVMLNRWEHLTYVHWPWEPQVVQQRLPAGLEVDTFDGAAWVGLIPFRMRLRLPVPGFPWISFPETNVRTYVRGPDGRRGVWFFSLDASRGDAVAVARGLWRLPYVWSRMGIERPRPDRVRYTARRRRPLGGPTSTSHVEVEVGENIEPDALDRFLVERYRLYATWGSRLLEGPVDHAPWQLRRAGIVSLDDGLVAAAGLGGPAGLPHVRFAEGTDVRIGRPRLVPTR